MQCILNNSKSLLIPVIIGNKTYFVLVQKLMTSNFYSLYDPNFIECSGYNQLN